ncbi:MAG: winged helix-turn-helix transcriptional regulator [Bdellovibrio bacteriovorus]
MDYAQFCPVAKATEILGEKWTLLIVRELLMGGTRFNELQRGLGLISPSLLTKRLKDLEQAGVVIRKKIPGQRGHEYLLTAMGRELLPVVMQLGEWGMRWARGAMPEQDLDVELLMLYLQRSIRPEALPGKETVVRFRFSDLKSLGDWWLLINDGSVDVCVQDPGREVDIYFGTDLRTMIQVWMGDLSYRAAMADGRMRIVGPSALTRDIKRWLAPHRLADIRPASEIAQASAD